MNNRNIDVKVYAKCGKGTVRRSLRDMCIVSPRTGKTITLCCAEIDSSASTTIWSIIYPKYCYMIHCHECKKGVAKHAVVKMSIEDLKEAWRLFEEQRDAGLSVTYE